MTRNLKVFFILLLLNSACNRKVFLQTLQSKNSAPGELAFRDFQCKKQVLPQSTADALSLRFGKLSSGDLSTLKLDDFKHQIQAYQWLQSLSPEPLNRNSSELLSRELLKLSQHYEFSESQDQLVGYFDFPFLKRMNSELSLPVTDYVTRIYDLATREVCDAAKPCCHDSTKVSYKSLVLAVDPGLQPEELEKLESNIQTGALVLLQNAIGSSSPVQASQLETIRSILMNENLRPRLATGKTLAHAKLAARFARPSIGTGAQRQSLVTATESQNWTVADSDLQQLMRYSLGAIKKQLELLKGSPFLGEAGSLSQEAFDAIRKNATEKEQLLALTKLVSEPPETDSAALKKSATQVIAKAAITLFQLLSPLEMPYFFRASQSDLPSDPKAIATLRQEIESGSNLTNWSDENARAQAKAYVAKLAYVSEIQFSGKTSLASAKFPDARLAVVNLDIVGAGHMITEVHRYWFQANPQDPLDRLLKGAAKATYNVVSVFDRNVSIASTALEQMCQTAKGLCDDTAVYASGDDIIGALWLKKASSTLTNAQTLASALTLLKQNLDRSRYGSRVHVRVSASVTDHPGTDAQSLEAALTSLHLQNEDLFTDIVKPAEKQPCKNQQRIEKIAVKDVATQEVSIQDTQVNCLIEL